MVALEPLNLVIAKFSGNISKALKALFFFLFIDFLDTTGTMLAVVSPLGISDEKGDFPKSRQAFAVDAIATMIGSIFGLSPITSYIESAAGVEAGGRTGITALVCAFYFLIAIFFAPILSSIPGWATGGALIIIGALMCRSLPLIQWNKIDHALTAFVTIMLMPLTYSIAWGLIGGGFVWLIMRGFFLIFSVFFGIKIPGEETEEEADSPKDLSEESDNSEKPEKEELEAPQDQVQEVSA